MKTSSFIKTGAIIFSSAMFFIGANVIAQNQYNFNNSNKTPKNNLPIIDVNNSKECASACGADFYCASWLFYPNIEKGVAKGGTCNFTSSSTPLNVKGALSGYPSKMMSNNSNISYGVNINNNQNNNSSSFNKNTNNSNGNYGIKPFAAPNNQMQQQSFMEQVQPQVRPIIPPPQAPAPTVKAEENSANNARVSFLRPRQNNINSAANVSTDVPQQKFVEPIVPPMPQKIQMQPPMQPAMQPPIEHDNSASNTKYLDKYRDKNGQIDAAQMRRDQLQFNNGQNGYSVQREWSQVAAAEANGGNQPNIFENSTPLENEQNKITQDDSQPLQDEASDTQISQEPKKKKSWFSFMKPKASTENNDTEAKASRPLRKRVQDQQEAQ